MLRTADFERHKVCATLLILSALLPFIAAARSVGASLAAPLGGIWQYEQVQTGEQEQGEGEQRHEAHPEGILLLFHTQALSEPRNALAA